MPSMFDTVTVPTLPDNAYAIAGYVGGNWPTFSPECQAFPALAKAGRILSIAVNASEDAECLDCEAGDASPDQCADWVKRQMARGVKKPVVYASVSAMQEVLSLLWNAGILRTQVRVWTAHYTHRPHLCDPDCGFGFSSTADATQWTDRALGRNLDQSEITDTFFSTAPLPVVNPEHYDWFDGRKRGLFAGRSERDVVQEYDRLRATQTRAKHPARARMRLYPLRIMLGLMASRVWRIAHQQKRPDGCPSWNVDRRGWRWTQLHRRSQGHRLA